MRELQILKREQFDLLVSAIAPKGLKCKVCKKKLTKDNFGFLAKDYYSCDNHKCLKLVVQECEIYDILRSGELTNHTQQDKTHSKKLSVEKSEKAGDVASLEKQDISCIGEDESSEMTAHLPTSVRDKPAETIQIKTGKTYGMSHFGGLAE